MREHPTSAMTGSRITRRSVLSTTGALVAGGLAGCLGVRDGTPADDSTDTDDGTGDSGGDPPAWRTTELARVRGDGVIQLFAVWCPKCERQSDALVRLPDSITQVSLNIDPNEDAAKVREHATENGFEWRFAVASPALTESLVEAFGTTVTNAPSTPIILACGDGSASFDAGGVRSATDLESMADGC